MPRAQCRHFVPQIMLAGQGPQPVIQAVESDLLGRRCAGIQMCRRTADRGFDRRSRGDHLLQRNPPQPPGAFGEIAGDIDGERSVELAHHRQREIPVVAIAVVEGKAGKSPCEIAFGQPLMSLVQGNEVDVERAKMGHHGAQEVRFDFQMPIGLEFAVAAGADMVQHEDRAHACEHWSHQVVRAGEVKRVQPGTDDSVAKLLLHGDAGQVSGLPANLARDR